MNEVVWRHKFWGDLFLCDQYLTHLIVSAIIHPPQRSFMLLFLARGHSQLIGPCVDNSSSQSSTRPLQFARRICQALCLLTYQRLLACFFTLPPHFQRACRCLAHSHKKLNEAGGRWQTSRQEEGKTSSAHQEPDGSNAGSQKSIVS